MFHLSTFDPSNIGIGSKLNNARKLLMLNPIVHVINRYAIISMLADVSHGCILNPNNRKISANPRLTKGPAIDITPFSFSVIIPV